MNQKEICSLCITFDYYKIQIMKLKGTYIKKPGLIVGSMNHTKLDAKTLGIVY